MWALITLPFKLIGLCLTMTAGILRAAFGMLSFALSNIIMLAILAIGILFFFY